MNYLDVFPHRSGQEGGEGTILYQEKNDSTADGGTFFFITFFYIIINSLASSDILFRFSSHCANHLVSNHDEGLRLFSPPIFEPLLLLMECIKSPLERNWTGVFRPVTQKLGKPIGQRLIGFIVLLDPVRHDGRRLEKAAQDPNKTDFNSSHMSRCRTKY